ncbi:hypothetical protein K435DRAFT_627292, partial [Dendrothele bispora CBS 962.96]
SYADVKEENGVSTRKSTMGYVFMVAGAAVSCTRYTWAVSWKSSKQRVVALSTTEAEYLSLVNAGKQAEWMHKFLQGLELTKEYPFTVFVDNTSAISLTEATTKHGRTKHFDTTWAWVREAVRAKE